MSLLFYDRVNGVGAFYSVDTNGNMSLLREDDGWRKTWWQIVPTGFYTPENPGPNDQLHLSLLFYDGLTGESELYSHDGAGNMTLLRSYSGWRRSWTQIVPGNWGGTRGLLFYDATAGEGAFYSVDNQGNLSLLKQYEGWRHSWHYILPIGPLGTTGNQSLLFYDGLAGEAEFYNVDSQGNMSLIHHETGWSTSWATIVSTSDVSKAVPGDQGQPVLSFNGLLFYDGISGVGEFYVLDTWGRNYLIQHHAGWRGSWASILQSDVRQFGKRPGGG